MPSVGGYGYPRFLPFVRTAYPGTSSTGVVSPHQRLLNLPGNAAPSTPLRERKIGAVSPQIYTHHSQPVGALLSERQAIFSNLHKGQSYANYMGGVMNFARYAPLLQQQCFGHGAFNTFPGFDLFVNHPQYSQPLSLTQHGHRLPQADRESVGRQIGGMNTALLSAKNCFQQYQPAIHQHIQHYQTALANNNKWLTFHGYPPSVLPPLVPMAYNLQHMQRYHEQLGQSPSNGQVLRAYPAKDSRYWGNHGVYFRPNFSGYAGGMQGPGFSAASEKAHFSTQTWPQDYQRYYVPQVFATDQSRSSEGASVDTTIRPKQTTKKRNVSEQSKRREKVLPEVPRSEGKPVKASAAGDSIKTPKARKTTKRTDARILRNKGRDVSQLSKQKEGSVAEQEREVSKSSARLDTENHDNAAVTRESGFTRIKENLSHKDKASKKTINQPGNAIPLLVDIEGDEQPDASKAFHSKSTEDGSSSKKKASVASAEQGELSKPTARLKTGRDNKGGADSGGKSEPVLVDNKGAERLVNPLPFSGFEQKKPIDALNPSADIAEPIDSGQTKESILETTRRFKGAKSDSEDTKDVEHPETPVKTEHHKGDGVAPLLEESDDALGGIDPMFSRKQFSGSIGREVDKDNHERKALPDTLLLSESVQTRNSQSTDSLVLPLKNPKVERQAAKKGGSRELQQSSTVEAGGSDNLNPLKQSKGQETTPSGKSDNSDRPSIEKNTIEKNTVEEKGRHQPNGVVNDNKTEVGKDGEKPKKTANHFSGKVLPELQSNPTLQGRGNTKGAQKEAKKEESETSDVPRNKEQRNTAFGSILKDKRVNTPDEKGADPSLGAKTTQVIGKETTQLAAPAVDKQNKSGSAKNWVAEYLKESSHKEKRVHTSYPSEMNAEKEQRFILPDGHYYTAHTKRGEYLVGPKNDMGIVRFKEGQKEKTVELLVSGRMVVVNRDGQYIYCDKGKITKGFYGEYYKIEDDGKIHLSDSPESLIEDDFAGKEIKFDDNMLDEATQHLLKNEIKDSRAVLDELFDSHIAKGLATGNWYSVTKRGALAFLYVYRNALEGERKQGDKNEELRERKKNERLEAIDEISRFIENLAEGESDTAILLRCAIQLALRLRESKLVTQKGIATCGTFALVKVAMGLYPLKMARICIDLLQTGKAQLLMDNGKKVVIEADSWDVLTPFREAGVDKQLMSALRNVHDVDQDGGYYQSTVLPTWLGVPVLKYNSRGGNTDEQWLADLEHASKKGIPVSASFPTTFTPVFREIKDNYKSLRKARDVEVDINEVLKGKDRSGSGHAVVIEKFTRQDSEVTFKVHTWGGSYKLTMPEKDFLKYAEKNSCYLLGSGESSDFPCFIQPEQEHYENRNGIPVLKTPYGDEKECAVGKVVKGFYGRQYFFPDGSDEDGKRGYYRANDGEVYYEIDGELCTLKRGCDEKVYKTSDKNYLITRTKKPELIERGIIYEGVNGMKYGLNVYGGLYRCSENEELIVLNDGKGFARFNKGQPISYSDLGDGRLIVANRQGDYITFNKGEQVTFDGKNYISK